jgi:hypothetical protein
MLTRLLGKELVEALAAHRSRRGARIDHLASRCEANFHIAVSFAEHVEAPVL